MKKLIVFLAAATLCAGYSYAQYEVLHNFAGHPADGEYPDGRLLFVGNGIFGVTPEGGANNIGMIFAMNRSGSVYVPFYHFGTIPNDGREPSGGLITDGTRLYGVTEYGGLHSDLPPSFWDDGYGTIFRIDNNGANYWIIHDFGDVANDGKGPVGPLVLRGSRLYGVTIEGGTSGSGILFSVNTDGLDYEILHHFAGSPDDGDYPSGGLFLDGNTLYGVTSRGGRYLMSAGTVYSIRTDGTGFRLLHSFSGNDGGLPNGTLVSDESTLYGGCVMGGAEGGVIGYYGGTAFALNRDGSDFTVLQDFSGSTVNGTMLRGGLTLDGDRLYGATAHGGATLFGAGLIFTVGTDGSGFDVLYECDGLIEGDGSIPVGSMLMDGGTLYGMMNEGGDTGNGVVFSYAVPTPAPNPTAKPVPPAEIILNGTSFGAGDPFSATFQLNESVTRSFTAYAVVILPSGAMLNALTLNTPLAPVVSNRPGLNAPFSYPLINVTVPAGAPLGSYEVVAAFFDPLMLITGRGDAFLEASGPFTVQ